MLLFKKKNTKWTAEVEKDIRELEITQQDIEKMSDFLLNSTSRDIKGRIEKKLIKIGKTKLKSGNKKISSKLTERVFLYYNDKKLKGYWFHEVQKDAEELGITQQDIKSGKVQKNEITFQTTEKLKRNNFPDKWKIKRKLLSGEAGK